MTRQRRPNGTRQNCHTFSLLLDSTIWLRLKALAVLQDTTAVQLAQDAIEAMLQDCGVPMSVLDGELPAPLPTRYK